MLYLDKLFVIVFSFLKTTIELRAACSLDRLNVKSTLNYGNIRIHDDQIISKLYYWGFRYHYQFYRVKNVVLKIYMVLNYSHSQ